MGKLYTKLIEYAKYKADSYLIIICFYGMMYMLYKEMIKELDKILEQ